MGRGVNGTRAIKYDTHTHSLAVQLSTDAHQSFPTYLNISITITYYHHQEMRYGPCSQHSTVRRTVPTTRGIWQVVATTYRMGLLALASRPVPVAIKNGLNGKKKTFQRGRTKPFEAERNEL